MLAIRVLNKSSNPLPSYETLLAAGMDIRANLDTTICLKPFERQLIPTGIHIELPQGYEAQIRPRSGLAFKYGISIVNAPGTIDADYRGEIKVLLINLSAQDFIVKHGDRIAQMVVARHEVVQWTSAQELTETNRGEHGYGHTGIM